MVDIVYRPAEVVEGGWERLATVSSARAAADELASWQWNDPGHGDLVRLVGPQVERIFVFDSARSAFVEAKTKRGSLVTKLTISMTSIWEGDSLDASWMMRLSWKVDRRRLALAACACAETSLVFVPDYEDELRAALNTARSWAHGNATSEDARRAYDAISDVADDVSENVDAAARSAYGAVLSALAVAAMKDNASSNSVGSASRASDAYASDSRASDFLRDRDAHLRSMAPLVRRYIPLSVATCAMVDARDPLPIPRDNPIRRGRR